MRADRRNFAVKEVFVALAAIGLVSAFLSITTTGCRMFADHGQVKPDFHAEVVRGSDKPTFPCHWKGKRVAFLGDSITDPRHVGCTENYWNFLPRFLGIDAYVYGRNGWRLDGMLKQAEWLREDLGDEVDAIFVFAGTNDFNGSVPRGEWYNEDILQAGRIWSVPVLDVSMTSGLLPTDAEYSSYFHDAESDMLHPSSQGHRRLALTMAHWMRSLPSDFK